jgi:hypothetical protein
VSGDDRDGQTGGSGTLEFAVVLHEPDDEKNEANEDRDHPCDQSGNAHGSIYGDDPKMDWTIFGEVRR